MRGADRPRDQTIDYDGIDFAEPLGGDTIATRDEEDRYFDDEEPSRTPSGRAEGEALTDGEAATQNGQGEYDY